MDSRVPDLPDSWRQFFPLIGIGMQVLATLIIATYGWTWFQTRRAAKGGVPSPAFVLPVVGDTIKLMQGPTKYMWEQWVRYGPIFITNLLGYRVYVVAAPSLLRSVWSDDAFDFFVPGETFGKLITDVRHMRNPEQHVMFRRKLTQALGPSALSAHLLSPMVAVMARHLDQWGKQGSVQLGQAVAEMSLDIALDVTSGIPLPPAGSPDLPLVRQLFRTTLNGLYGLPIVLPGTVIYAALRARRRLMEMLWPLVEAEARDLEAKADKASTPRSTTAAAAATGVDASQTGLDAAPMRMLEAQVASAAPFRRTSALTPEQLFERALGNVIAVDETSRHLFFAAVTAVALAPKVKARLEDEQREVLRQHGTVLSYNVLNSMPYSDAVVKEVLRLCPPSIGGFRRAKRDFQFDNKDAASVIPAGSIVFWSTHLIHGSDPALLPRTLAPEAPSAVGSLLGRAPAADTSSDKPQVAKATGKTGVTEGFDTVAGRHALACACVGPTGLPSHMDFQTRFDEAFRPERWLNEETRPRQFAVFGGGVHLCLGQQVAMAEAKLLLTLLLRRFDFRLEDPAILRTCSSFPGLKPRKGTDTMLLTPRSLV